MLGMVWLQLAVRAKGEGGEMLWKISDPAEVLFKSNREARLSIEKPGDGAKKGRGTNREVGGERVRSQDVTIGAKVKRGLRVENAE
jgi:hypothetical protein